VNFTTRYFYLYTALAVIAGSIIGGSFVWWHFQGYLPPPLFREGEFLYATKLEEPMHVEAVQVEFDSEGNPQWLATCMAARMDVTVGVWFDELERREGVDDQWFGLFKMRHPEGGLIIRGCTIMDGTNDVPILHYPDLHYATAIEVVGVPGKPWLFKDNEIYGAEGAFMIRGETDGLTVDGLLVLGDADHSGGGDAAITVQ
jgi:hypothetical protein